MSARPLPVGHRLEIVPHGAKPENASRIPLFLGPGAAFGSGTHQTTRDCLLLLEKMPLEGKTVLDIGCGTGILSLAALQLGARRAFAFDIDPAAAANTNANAERNDLSERLLAWAGGIESLGLPVVDRVLVNLYGDLVLRFLDAVTRPLKRDGMLLVSGVRWEERMELCRGLERRAFLPEAERHGEDYVTMRWKRTPSR